MPSQHTPSRLSFAARFWRYVDTSGDCWIWTGATNGRYGKISRGPGLGLVGAHRASWEIHFGPTPDGLWVLHRCDNPPCVRPDHLWLGTNQDNIDDKVAKGRALGAYGGERHHLSKLTKGQGAEVRQFAEEGLRQREIAARYGVNRATISKIIRGKLRRAG